MWSELADPVIDYKKIKSQHAFVAMSDSSLNLRRRLPRLNIHEPHPHLMFSGPLKKGTAAALVFGTTAVGTVAVLACCFYAQRLKGLW